MVDIDELKRLAQPAEAEGVELVAYVGCQARMTTDGWENGEEYVVFADQASDADRRYDVPLMTVTQHLAALSAVTAERDRLAEKIEALRVNDLFAAGVRHADEAATKYIDEHWRTERDQLRAELDELALKFAASDYSYDQSTDQLRAEVEALRKDAARWRLYRQGFFDPEALDASVDSALSAQGDDT